MRNRFQIGDELEILSPSNNFNKIITVQKMESETGEEILDAKLVQQKIYLYTDYPLQEGDILRKYNKNSKFCWKKINVVLKFMLEK